MAVTLGACGSEGSANLDAGQTTGTGEATTGGKATGGDTTAPATTGGADDDATTGTAPDGGSESTEGSTDTGAPGECPFLPNPTLAAIPDNTALDLGRYECEDRLPQIPQACNGIFDYSRINYDPKSHRFVIFGGGHAASGRTDVDAFDVETLAWDSLYPSISCEEVQAEDIDPRGFHIDSGHPVARHSYDQNVVAEVDGVLSLLMFSSEGFAGWCHQYNAPINAVAKLSLEDDESPWTYSPEFEFPWAYAGAAEVDPKSGMVILIGRSRGAGPSGLWVYDPSADSVVHSQPASAANHGNLHYDPAGDRMILLYDTETGLEQREIILDRNDWAATTTTELVTRGPAPAQARASAYDSRNHIIGAFGEAGVFSALDLATDTWSTHEVVVDSADPEVTLGQANSFAMDYDPVDNVFIFMGVEGSQVRTWAYRYLGPATQCE